MKKLNKKHVSIFIALFSIVLIVGMLCFFYVPQITFNRLTDAELKTVDHFGLLSSKTLSKEILEEKHFVIDEDITTNVPNSTAYTYHSLADGGVDETGIEHCSAFISDKGELKHCNLYYSFTDINDKKLEALVNAYCKAAGKKSFEASYRLPQKNQKVSFEQIANLPLPESEESGPKGLTIQNYSPVRYDLFQYKGNGSMAVIMNVYDTGKVELFVSFDM